jgi:hypothetical protein
MKAVIMVRLTGNKVASMETQAAVPCARYSAARLLGDRSGIPGRDNFEVEF